MENLDLWHTFEKQGGKVLHTIRTRDTATAKACLAAPKMLEALMYAQSAMAQTVVALYDAPEFDRRKSEINELHACINQCLAAIAEAEGVA